MVLILSVINTGCNSWLNVDPENEQTTDNFWQSKEEVQEVLMGAYSGYRKMYRKFIQWGELRGDGIILGGTQDAVEKKIKELDINYENSICSWADFYNVIGRANSVIQYSASVLDKDITYTIELSNALVAEAVFLRSLCYFYLVRTFGDVPLVTKAYVDDSEGYDVPKVSEKEVLDFIISDLEKHLTKCKYKYDTDWETKGRATRWAFHALLADVALWNGDYDKCIKYCNAIIDANQFRLLAGDEYFSLYYPGNSDESIFEIQWSKQYGQTNSLYGWFFNGTGNSNYIISNATRELFEGENVHEADLRGVSISYISSGDYDAKIWKYAGTGMYGEDGEIRSSEMRDPNWIVYRYSEILLLKAEAQIMKGIYMPEELLEIRRRAGLKDELFLTSEREALLALMEERHKEFLGEGKRWFDILRMARIDNYSKYQDYVTEVLLAGVDAKDRPKWESLLSDPNSYYLPVHKNDIENSNGVITQNPYYKNDRL